MCLTRWCDRTQRAFGKFLSISCHMLTNNSTAVGCIHCYIGDMWHVISAGARCGLIQLVSSIDDCFLLGRSWHFTDWFISVFLFIFYQKQNIRNKKSFFMSQAGHTACDIRGSDKSKWSRRRFKHNGQQTKADSVFFNLKRYFSNQVSM